MDNIENYPKIIPFNPSIFYPEYPFSKDCLTNTEKNEVYQSIRDGFLTLGMDRQNYGKPNWNPLGEIIRPGETILLKPNWVYHELTGFSNPQEILITHPSIIRSVLDYVFIACGYEGKIILGDAPIQGANFTTILEISGIKSIVGLFKNRLNYKIEVEDFRGVTSHFNEYGQITQSEKIDSFQNSRLFDLGDLSFFKDISDHWKLFRVNDYESSILEKNHNENSHKYLISNYATQADVIINLPKLKTHKLTGVTASLKNLVGINVEKAFLPHFRIGSSSEFGDDFPKKNIIKKARTKFREKATFSKNKIIWSIIKILGRSVLNLQHFFSKDNEVGGIKELEIFSGCWYGNDTAWRMVLDLNQLIFNVLGNSEKKIRHFSIIDAVISGEKFGPLEPTPVNSGTIIMGLSPLLVDLVAIHCMGFDHEKLPLYKNAIKYETKIFDQKTDHDFRINYKNKNILLKDLEINWKMTPPVGWIGFIER